MCINVILTKRNNVHCTRHDNVQLDLQIYVYVRMKRDKNGSHCAHIAIAVM